MSLFSASQAKNDPTILLDLLTSISNKTLANCLRTRSRYCLGTSFGNCTINSWNGTIISKTRFNIGAVCARNFTTGSPAPREPLTILSMSKEFTKHFWQQRKRFFRNSAITMDSGYGKKPPYSDTPCGSGSSNVRQNPIQQPGPCRQPYERRKPCPPLEKCVRASPPCCRPRPKNHKCPKLPQPCPPPCPIPCPKPLEKPPPPKICYRKCPPLPKLPKLPTCRKIPAPPPPPPLPRLPKLPKCPPPCPPPSPPSLPTCPKPPRCPECPPQQQCPPPPPCEPCPCPLPCPPPSCPPPPPCPPCPLPIPCPKPLPCPLPPPARVCPPCPPCPEHPKPPPCPPPPPCCPCPCPEPPPVCPCPKPCPPCPEIVEPPPSCPDDLPSCPKSNNPLHIKTRKMSTYRWPLLPLGNLPSRGLRLASVLPGKSDKSDKPSKCKSLTDICQDKKDSSCVKRCERKPDCDTKRKPCTDQLNNLTNKKKKKKKELCSDSCIPKGKCEQPRVPAPPKMQYGAVKCPTPKFVSPKPCPDVPEPDNEPDHSCTELRSANKPKKEVCVPPPLPKPPTKPVVLCPCPPPPKMHPGPCPCQEMKQEPPQKITVQPCSVKEKYICPLEPHYCPQEKTICRRDKTCDPNKRKNKKKK